MKKTILFFAAILSLSTTFAQVYVGGYTKHNGTVVGSHWRTSPNYTRDDNWSAKGNINPYTGSVGTKPGGYNNSCCNPPKNYYPSVPRYNYSIPNNYNW
jgi:hypothetical protein